MSSGCPERLAGKTICGRGAPFKYIQPKFGVMISLVRSIAQIDNGSSAIEEGRGMSHGRCGENASK